MVWSLANGSKSIQVRATSPINYAMSKLRRWKLRRTLGFLLLNIWTGTLGFLCRSDFDTHDQRARRPLYLSLVRSSLAYCSHVWAPQAVNLILDIERIQRRATKIILSLPYRSHVSYEQRLLQRQKLLLRSGVRIQIFDDVKYMK